MALDELDGQTRLSDTTTTDYYELVLAEELRRGSARAVATSERHGRHVPLMPLRRREAEFGWEIDAIGQGAMGTRPGMGDGVVGESSGREW